MWTINLCAPAVSYALTSGPSQPEARSFQPAGTSDMVDLFSGDFKYNVPLFDIDGYPVNLNYASGSGMDDEASWVGLGWNVNVGAINRQVRGIPDDMSGDNIESDNYTKPKVTVGGRVSAKVETIGKSIVGLSGSVSLGIFNDSYTGIGAEVSADPGISVGLGNGSPLTAGLGLGVSSNTASGASVEVSPFVDLATARDASNKSIESAGLSASLGYNSRSGLKGLTLSSSFGQMPLPGLSYSYNTEPIQPKISIPYKSRYGSFSLDVGVALEVVFVGGGIAGYKNVQEVSQEVQNNPAYGFLYAERGKNQPNAVMDFQREKDNPVIPELPNLALPVQTPDIFSYTSQTGSGQFRLYRGGSGAFFDNQVTDDDASTTLGVDAGFGALGHGGVTLFEQTIKNTTSKWTNNNNYLPKADFQDISYTNPSAQHVYFKEMGEKTAEDANMVAKLHDVQPLAVNISGINANASFTNNSLIPLQKLNRQVNNTVISYLTAQEADLAGLDRTIANYHFNIAGSFVLPANNKPVPAAFLKRWGSTDTDYRKPHHISEITVNGNDGKRMVYGLPVYNITQREYNYAIGKKGTDYNLASGTNAQVPLSVNTSNPAAPTINHTKGIDNYYHMQTQPAYASSYLLTGILSPDYVDKTGDGITDDDAGTAIKFNYSKLPNLFKWRTPYHNGTLNKGLLADPDDDKASIVYGEKEIWYVHSIESKTKIAYFITQYRRDALGVTDFTGLTADTSNKQRCLTEIRLYSKADMSKPIKVIKFTYAYELCRGVPNNMDNLNGLSTDPEKGGKLTLKSIYFEYGNSPKGANYPYVFTYNNSVNGQAVNYGDMLTDRWGIYKSPSENLLPLQNDEFPYTNQDVQGSNAAIKAREDQNAALWHLTAIQLPSGGNINVSYESDDYAYVQDKRAMVMCPIQSMVNAGGNDLDSTSVSYFRDAKGIKVQIPVQPPPSTDVTNWFEKTYLNGSTYLYSKFLEKMSTSYSSSGGDDDDFVSCYSSISKVTVSGNSAIIYLADRSDGGVTANPMIFSAWQKMKDEYPRYAYPGFDSRVGDSGVSAAVENAVKAVFSAIGNLSELTENFYKKAFNKDFAAQVHLNRSFVRLVKQDGFKLGGGVRVKKIQISDNWQTMGGNSNSVNASYGQEYDYTTVDNGAVISSGVAAYEPAIGGEENPLRQPVPYIEHIKGAIDSFFDLEQPFGESFFPSPSVGYSKITVTDLDKNGNPDPALRTGYSESDFYTAKDFPVQVTALPLQQNEQKPKSLYSFITSASTDELTMSQGYSIMLNDMHGKLKASRTFNQGGAEIESSVYDYNTSVNSSGITQLNNSVPTIGQDGTVANQVLGRDIDFFTDFRQQTTNNNGTSVLPGFDIIDLFFFAFPLPHFIVKENSEFKQFRSACAVKVSQNYGILNKVVKTVNGSSITTQDLAYDPVTGDPVVTSSQNEFNKTIYSVNLPAYWVYKGMGPAYQNLGQLLKGFAADNVGELGTYSSFLQPGDELVDVSPNSTGNKYWVIQTQGANSPTTTADTLANISTLGNGNNGGIQTQGANSPSTMTKKIVDVNGKLVTNIAPALVKLIRSGYRNMLNATTTSLVCLSNPIQNNQLKLTTATDMTSLQVINASATTYDQNWGMPVNCNLLNGMMSTNPLPLFTYSANVGNAAHGDLGAYFIGGSSSGQDTVVRNSFLMSRFDQIGIWPTPATTLDVDELLGFSTTINIPASGEYYIGFSGDNLFHYAIDGNALPKTNDLQYWYLLPVYLTSGSHQLSMNCVNQSSDGNSGTSATNPGGMALEIYGSTANQLQSATNTSSVNIVFSTRNLANVTTLQSFRTINGVQVYHFTYDYGMNPYINGFLGNWRPSQTLVFQQSRADGKLISSTTTGVDVKDAGYITKFFNYWSYNPATLMWTINPSGGRWVAANTVTLYDQYGQQLENMDALGRYSAATFGFNGELPTAVASNAMNREIYDNAFEDTKFTPGALIVDTCTTHEFIQPSTSRNISTFVTDSLSHSGNYSVLMPQDGFSLSTKIHTVTSKSQHYLDTTQYKEFETRKVVGLYPKGFEPYPGKKYILDAWIKDNNPTTKSTPFSISINIGGASSVNVSYTCRAIVENWKLIEATIDLTNATNGNALNITLVPGMSGMLIDDIRIHPYDANMKTYVYDDQSMHLMAEIDENSFATFYEYDDEGLLIRVKKETERGVMTIKETRSSYKK
ncbi:hypothetical protein [Mucilaginibacter sp.]